MTVSFELPELGKATGNGLNQESLGLLGVEMASENLPDDHMFSRMGGWNVTFRASIVRIAFFKLLGIGLVAAFMATSPHVGAFTAWSLTMSAAINLVACAHYYWICECFRFKPFLFMLCSTLSAHSHLSLFPSCPQGTSAHRPTGCPSTTRGWQRSHAHRPRTRNSLKRSRNTTSAQSTFRR